MLLMRSLVVSVLVAALSVSVITTASSSSASADPASPVATTTALSVLPLTGAHIGAAITLRAAVVARQPDAATARFVSPVSGQVRFTRDGSVVGKIQSVVAGEAAVSLLAAVGRHSFGATFTPSNPTSLAASTSSSTIQTVAAPSSILPLSRGAYGSRVAAAQRMLVEVGILLPLTATYDPATVAAITRFQGKFGLPVTGRVDAQTWQRLSTLAKSGALPTQCSNKGTVICVNKKLRILRLVVNGKVIAGLDARFGSPRHMTREGKFRIYHRYVTHTSSDYGTPMPYALFFSRAEAIHFSDAFKTTGYKNYSHGCVNLRDIAGAKALFSQAPVGTRVFVYRG